MRKFTDEIKDYILENLTDQNTFTKKYVDIARDLNITQQQSRNAMIQIVKEGILEIVQPSHKGLSSNPIYKLKSHKLSMTEFNPITDENDDTKIVEFEGVTIILKRLPDSMSYCISVENVATCILENPIILNKIINSNKEIFDGHIFDIDGKQFLDHIGTLSVMLKINMDAVLPIKKSMMKQFNDLVVSIMCDSQLRAKLHITSDNRIKIQSNIECLLDLDKSQVQDMITDLEWQMSKTIENVSGLVTQKEVQINKLEKEVKHLTSRVETEKIAKERLMTQSNELKAKLLERN